MLSSPPAEIIFKIDLSFPYKLAHAAEAEPQERVSPAPASLVLKMRPLKLSLYSEIFTSLKKARFLNFDESSSKSNENNLLAFIIK